MNDLILQSIPSPEQGVWYLGPFPLRAYALCIIAGVIAAVWIGDRRWVARGGRSGEIADIAIWAVPFGIVGGRLYHVITDSGCYIGGADRCEGVYKGPWGILYVWQGGLGIWGAVALGAFGAYIGARRMGIKFLPVADALAPGVLVAQAIGRFGNYFNQELFGRPTDLPWALEIPDVARRPEGYQQFETFHPTFLYEAIWNVAIALVIIWADRRFRLGYGRVFALYVAGYCAGRGWIEYLRIDPVEASDVFGLRLNVWTSIVVGLAAVAFFVWSSRRHPGREERVYREGHGPDAEADAGGTAGETTDETGEPAEARAEAAATSPDASGETAHGPSTSGREPDEGEPHLR